MTTPNAPERLPAPSDLPDPGKRGPHRARVGRAALVAAGLVVVGFALTIVAVFADHAGNSPRRSLTVPARVEPSATVALSPRTSGSPGAAQVFDVPASVDPTGARDVTDTLQRFLDLAPDGAKIRLAPGATYRVDGTLLLDRRTGLVIDGRGATLHPTTIADFERRTWSVIDSTDITFRDLSIVGAHPNGGTYVPKHEHEHGFAVQGGGGVTIELARVSNVYGDCLYVAADDAGIWADGVRFMDSSCTATGRNGVAVVAGKNVEVARSSFSKIALFPLDVEPNQAQHLEGASGIAFHDNRIAAPVGDYVVAANGWGPIDHLSVTGNLVTGRAFILTVHPLDGSGYRRSAIAITGNRSDTSPIRNGPVMDFAANDGLVVTGNTQPFLNRGVFAHVIASCEVAITGNVVDKATEAVIEPTSCP